MRFTVLRQIKAAAHQNVVFAFIGGRQVAGHESEKSPDNDPLESIPRPVRKP